VSQSLSRWQAAVLGLVVLTTTVGGVAGLVAVAANQGVWRETFELTVGFPDVHDVTPGTPVRVRGLDAGQVVAIDYPDTDAPTAAVVVKLKLDAKYRGRVYADATATIQSTGLLGSKVISVSPGTPAAGPLTGDRLTAARSADPAAAAEKLVAVADEAEKLLKEVRTGNGTLARLVQDDTLYHDLKGVAKKADSAVSTVEKEAANVRGVVRDGQETLRSVKQGTDALQRMPIVRSYVEDATAILVRPTHRREAINYNTHDLFEPGTAILTETGKAHLEAVVERLKGLTNDKAEVAFAALCDPADPSQTPASAGELTKKQAEAAAEFLKARGAHKLGWWSRRKVVSVGLGTGPSPLVSPDVLPASYLQVLVFYPQ
jgi:phospholipid/cholesterol/gamma-HCH transport system substrate-binding protein